RPADARRHRHQEAKPDDGDAGDEVVAELAEPALAPGVAVVLGVLLAQHPAAVHQSMNRVLHQRADQEGQQERRAPVQPHFPHDQRASTTIRRLRLIDSRSCEAASGPQRPQLYQYNDGEKSPLSHPPSLRGVHRDMKRESSDGVHAHNGDIDTQETREWIASLDAVLQTDGPDRAGYLLSQLENEASRFGVEIPFSANTPYINPIPAGRQPAYPGNRDV